MRWTATRRRDIASTAILALLLAAQAFSLLGPLDRFLADQRYRFSDRPVSGDIVFVAIDKKSLDAVGVWPWPRSIHGEITDRLRALGARDIVFDIDFSTPSTPENDAAFAAAIERAQGTVTLPVFLQNADASSPFAEPLITAPIDILARNAWLASVTVYPDSDGNVRHFPFGLDLGPGFIESIPATIAGSAVETGDDIFIDFGIDTDGFATVSAIDLLEGTAAGDVFADKTVVIGAFATELRDFYAIPGHGFIPGAVLQGIAAETLIANRNLRQIDPMPVAIIAFVALLGLMVALRRQTALQTVMTFVSISLIAEPVAIGLYVAQGVMLPTGFIHVSALTALAMRALAMTELFRRLTREATTDARNLRQVLQQVVHENFDAIVVTDEDGRALQVSEAVRDVFDLGEAAVQTGEVVHFLPSRLCIEMAHAMAEARVGHTPIQELRTLSFPIADGTQRAIEYTIAVSQLRNAAERKPRSGPARGPIVACLTARDITERLSYEEKLRWLSDHDAMTGLRRRHAFEHLVDRSIGQRDGCAVLVFNLHRFKTVNVTLGRETGNAVLHGVAQRLQTVDERVAGTARLSGDTFAVLICGVRDQTDALDAANRVVSAVAAPYPVDRGSANIGVQAGLSLCSTGGDAEGLLEQAEMALDEARAGGGSRIVLYNEALATHRRRSRIIERDLWEALERDQLHLAYQMQVALSDHAPRGAEALVRWTHPTLGSVRPDEFIGIAEANGFISELGRWVLFTACREAASWSTPISISVNVAPQQFARDAIVDEVREALAQSGLDAKRLIVELVESELLDSDSGVLSRMDALRALGVRIALDDFGTGYSGIGYLTRMRFDEIKIDKRFTDDITTKPEIQGIVRSVALLGESFGMNIVCEGIETPEQETLMRLIGCDTGQGYLYSKPIDAASFRALLRATTETAREAVSY